MSSIGESHGKVLRINTDGTTPRSNPFLSDEAADPTVYAVGIRDPQGMVFKPGTNDLLAVEKIFRANKPDNAV